ncbi:unnamed protein product [Malus baccata var. baccata]
MKGGRNRPQVSNEDEKTTCKIVHDSSSSKQKVEKRKPKNIEVSSTCRPKKTSSSSRGNHDIPTRTEASSPTGSSESVGSNSYLLNVPKHDKETEVSQNKE